MSDDGWEELRREIDAEGGIKVIEAWRLRDLAGWAKLGVNVIVDIANQLRDHDFDTLPVGKALPTNQYEDVRIYTKGSRLGKVVEAIMSPTAKGDQLLREICSSDDANDAIAVLDRVRQLVCPS